MSELPDTDLPPTAPDQRVRVAVLVVDDGGLDETLAAIDRQVYGIEGVTLVDTEGVVADDRGRSKVADFGDFVGDLDPSIDLVWIVHGDARPRPDALGALVAEIERSDASLVGSKIMDAALPDRLESVGSATDVFGEPYTGLDPDEVDLEQYDVVRDVAFVSAVSMLVRRDLLRGMRGIDPLLAPVAAGMDFSQRARVAGGRVMVVPSSEVLHARTCREEDAGWREWAGRMRSMLKAYRLVTLAWVVPIGTLLGLLDGLARLFLGKPRTLGEFGRALVWNLVHLPGSLAARSSVRAVRQVGDEELFRYQVSGSVRMRALANDVAERFGWVIDDEPGVVTEEDLEDESTAAGAVVAALALVVTALATRSFWAGTLPQSGFTFRVADTAAAMGGFAGGWNPAGLGSSEPVHPSAAFFAGLEWMTGGWGGTFRVAVAALLATAFFAGGRLLRELGVTGPTRHLAALLTMGGIGVGAFATDADLAGWLAIGPILATLALVVTRWPAGWRARVGRTGGILVGAAAAGLLAPGAGLVIVGTALLVWLLVPGFGPSVAGRGLLAADVALLAASPYLAAVSVDELTELGPSYDLVPGFGAALMVGVAVVAGIAFLPAARHRVAAVGGLLLAAAVWFPWLEAPRGDLGATVALAGLVGLVLVTGAAVGFDRDGAAPVLVGRVLATAAALALVGSATLNIVDGRAGFPADEWGDRLEFTESLVSESDAARILLVGDAERLPGESRTVGEVDFRVVSVSGPALETARLGVPRLGDVALADLVGSIAGGELVRPGERLAEFGIGWVAVIDDPAFTRAMTAQVDMDEVQVREDLTVFLSRVPAPRAVTDSGVPWEADGGSFVGPASDGTVRIADNASPRWGPDWQQDDWANRVSAANGLAAYEIHGLRRVLAWVTASLLAVGVVSIGVGVGVKR